MSETEKRKYLMNIKKVWGIGSICTRWALAVVGIVEQAKAAHFPTCHCFEVPLSIVYVCFAWMVKGKEQKPSDRLFSRFSPQNIFVHVYAWGEWCTLSHFLIIKISHSLRSIVHFFGFHSGSGRIFCVIIITHPEHCRRHFCIDAAYELYFAHFTVHASFRLKDWGKRDIRAGQYLRINMSNISVQSIPCAQPTYWLRTSNGVL